MTIVMTHANPVSLSKKSLLVDRKFHVGMEHYAANFRDPIVTINPAARENDPIMDPIEIPLKELHYGIETIPMDAVWRPLPAAIKKMRTILEGAKLVYGTGYGNASMAREFSIPYVMVLEYDLPTQMTVTASQVRNPLRQWVRQARCAYNYWTHSVSEMRSARSLHCNGYPIYEAVAGVNANRLLYLDSRMSVNMLISEDQLARRLENRRGQPLKLLYSGRFERMKGSADAVKVGMECLRRGMNVELHCYGQGTLRSTMQKLATDPRIQIHEPVPYPELVRISKEFDLFVCCHIQSDPSCTYLEALGAGLPVVGYDNRMLCGLARASGAASASKMGRPVGVVESIQRILAAGALSHMSRRALQFAEAHVFEAEFKKRIDGVNMLVGEAFGSA